MSCQLPLRQARRQAMTTVGAAAFSAGLYTYIMFYYKYTVYTLCIYKRKKHLYQDHKLDPLDM
jgi:hypothetical protein